MPHAASLPELRRAVAARTPVAFSYHDEARVVDPWGLLLRDGFWYLIGHDHGRSARRTYRIDRIQGAVEVHADEHFDRPADFDPSEAFPADPKLIGADARVPDARVLVDAPRASIAIADLGEERLLERHDDGSI
jgi:predicted DNA-binding transcriptional regulator YafY